MLNYLKSRTAAEFDAGYANQITPEVVARWEQAFRERSQAVLTTHPPTGELVYGPDPRQRIDFFRSRVAQADAPTLIAIHGGLWFLFGRWMMHFLVPAFTAAGVHVACPGYRLAPAHGLGEIVGDCRQAVRFLARQAGELGLTPGRFSVLGHSAAGQLAAVVAATDWPALDAGLSSDLVRSWIGVSGFYDIEPFAQTGFQPLVGFAEQAYRRWNPANLARPGLPPALLLTGARESDLLHDMMTGYAGLLAAAGVSVRTMDAVNECHFSVLARLGEPDSAMHHAVLSWLR